MCRGLAEETEMPKLRAMVIELCSNLDMVVLTSDKEAVVRYLKTKRRFTNAEAGRICVLHYNFKNPRRKLNNGKEDRL